MNKIHIRGDFKAHPGAAQVVIDAVFDGERFILEDGSPLPSLEPGARVKLRTNAANLVDPAQRAKAKQSHGMELLPPGQELYAVVDLSGLQDQVRHDGYAPSETRWRVEQARAATHDVKLDLADELNGHEGLIPLRLLEPLVMLRQGDKPSRLRRCKCVVDGLDDGPVQVSSLNQALQMISERMEIHRASHAGNVFRRIVVPQLPRQVGSVFLPAITAVRLGRLREWAEAKGRVEGAAPGPA